MSTFNTEKKLVSIQQCLKFNSEAYSELQLCLSYEKSNIAKCFWKQVTLVFCR